MSKIIRKEFAGAVLGVPGRFHNVTQFTDVERVERARWRIANQQWVSERRPIRGYGAGGEIQVYICHDDVCKNGHESFAITANVWTTESKRRRDIQAGGCLHDDIAEVFPELAPLIRWHLMSTDSPMHYISNACYLAGDRDYRGKRKGEPESWEEVIRFGDFPITFKKGDKFRQWLKAALEFCAATPAGNPNRPSFDLVEVPHEKDPKTYGTKYTLAGFEVDAWYKCPFDTRTEAEQFAEALARYPVTFEKRVTAYSEGKERELDAAREAACWPDAPDEVLRLPREELEKILIARLPGLVNEFRAAVEGIGFIWTGVQS